MSSGKGKTYFVVYGQDINGSTTVSNRLIEDERPELWLLRNSGKGYHLLNYWELDLATALHIKQELEHQFFG